MPLTQASPSTRNGHTSSDGDNISSSTARGAPDVVLDTTNSVVHILRPGSPRAFPSSIHNDISIHNVPDSTAEEQLNTFRRSFLSTFPFVHIPPTTSAVELRQQKPFLWLVIMSLTTKFVSQQFAMEEVIWHIISRRIVAQQIAELDLLLGLVCFASWSHYFKQEKPFMTMLAQLAVSLTFELGLNHDISASRPRPSKDGQHLTQQPPRHPSRTLEERRTILSVYHVTSSTWTAYRKTEPLRWTSYMDQCLRVLDEEKETKLDSLLVFQIKCQIITNQLNSPPTTDPGPDIAQLYSHDTELTIQESMLRRPRAQDRASGLSSIQRIRDLDTVLACVERWQAVSIEMAPGDWIGISVDGFTQFTHCLVVLFKLTMLEEPGWDVDEVRKRADVFGILDHTCEVVHRVPAAVGMVDADGPRNGLFFKVTYFLRAIKALFLSELPPTIQVDSSRGNSSDPADPMADVAISDDFILNLADEPWFSDIMGSTWDFGIESPFDTPFPT
ncbi:hypothetical protein MGN70_006039 [Eutypa lata]|nr:hypothetical protein MGN70_006039 [Eutypa lata]